MEPVAAAAVGRYEIVRPIGEGGMAHVYLCIRRGAGGFEKRVVIKVLHSKFVGDSHYVQMFLDEARLLARIQHPNIVDVFEVECVNGIPYLAMEYVNGPTLGKLHKRAVRAGIEHTGYLLHIVLQVCLGLNHAHGMRINGLPGGIVHRDVSSQNIVIEAETGVAKLIDFGIAKVGDESHAKTEVGVLKGKIHYMAPETLRGAKPDARVDLYAVGVLIYRIVTNRMPFAEGDDIWAARLSGRYPKASEVARNVSPQMDAIIDRALHPDPTKRYQTGSELAIDLQTEIERLGTDPTRISEWIRTVFPGGEEEWFAPFDPSGLAASTMHSSLNHLVTDGGIPGPRTPVAPSTSPARLGAIAGASAALVAAILLSGAAAAGLAVWAASAQGPGSVENAVTYLDAADQLVARDQFEDARTMNHRADALGVADASIVVRIARQKGDIDREEALTEAGRQAAAGEVDAALATLSDAMEANPSDVALQTMFTNIGALRTPDAPPAVPPEAADPEPEATPDGTKAAAVRAPPKPRPHAAKTSEPTSPSAPAAVPGGVTVRTTPASLIFFDGNLVGESPVTIQGVAPGDYTIEARLEGYQRGRMAVAVQSDRVSPVELALVAEAP